MELVFLNVDLDVRSAESLAPLVAALGDEVVALRNDEHAGRFHAVFELAACAEEPESVILGLCALIETLPAGARVCWEGCELRAFNLGYELAPGGPAAAAGVSAAALARMAALGAELVFTLYDPARIPPMARE